MDGYEVPQKLGTKMPRRDKVKSLRYRQRVQGATFRTLSIAGCDAVAAK